jgi:hypothetical protein
MVAQKSPWTYRKTDYVLVIFPVLSILVFLLLVLLPNFSVVKTLYFRTHFFLRKYP